MSSADPAINAEDLKFIWERVQKRNSKDDFAKRIRKQELPSEETLEGRGDAEANLIRKDHWDKNYKHGLKGKLILKKSGDDFSRMLVAFYHDGDNREYDDVVGIGSSDPGYNGIAISVICNEISGDIEPHSYTLQANMLEGGCEMSFNISADEEKKAMVLRMIGEAVYSAKEKLADAPVIPAPDQQKVLFG
ncbi:MAG: hypothetical protein AAF244_03225 [Pseudomonadota bacterium]